MKKVLLSFVILISTQAIGQTIPNAGFETWVASGPFLAPDGWAVSPGVIKSTDAHSGSYALQCKLDTFTNPSTSVLDTITATAYTGAQTMGPPVPGSNIGGYAFTSRPDSLTGYYKYQKAPNDSFRISVLLCKKNTVTGGRDTIASALFTSGTAISTYTRFSMPLQYVRALTPDTAVIQVLTANPQAPKHLGTSIWVDDLAFVTNPPAGVDNLTEVITKPLIYPNPFCDVLAVTPGSNAAILSMVLSNSVGSIIAHTKDKTLNTSDLPCGVYFVTILTDDGIKDTFKVIKQ